MQNVLIEKLRGYIAENNPDMMLRLHQGFSMTAYLEEKVKSIQPLLDDLTAQGKPAYIIEEICMNALTADLRPSKFNYIKGILAAEFEETYNRFREMGVLSYEVVNLIEACEAVFEKHGFSEDKSEDRMLNNEITGAIAIYLEK